MNHAVCAMQHVMTSFQNVITRLEFQMDDSCHSVSCRCNRRPNVISGDNERGQGYHSRDVNSGPIVSALASDSAGDDQSYKRVTHAYVDVGTDEDGFSLVRGRKSRRQDYQDDSKLESKDTHVHKDNIVSTPHNYNKYAKKNNFLPVNREKNSGRGNPNVVDQNQKLNGQEKEENLKKKNFLILPMISSLSISLEKNQKKKLFFLRFCRLGLKRRN